MSSQIQEAKSEAVSRTEKTVLILAPMGRDAELTSSILSEAKVDSEICRTINDLLSKLTLPYGAVLLTEEAIDDWGLEALNQKLKNQPPWSDIPLILMTCQGTQTQRAEQILNTFAATGNVTVYERPVRTSTLVSAVHVALRARERQYLVRQLMDEQKRATKARDEFISIASHELRTPITVLKLQADLMRRQLERNGGTLTPEQARNLVMQIVEQTNRISRLVEDMLDVSRIHVGKFTLRPETCDFSELIKESIERFGPQLAHVGSNVIFTGEAVTGTWDRYRLEQVINNLFTNAIRYAPGTPIRIEVKKEDGQLLMIFEDQGKGIPSEHLETVFNRFERGTNSGIHGLGLGLYISRQIVTAHNGVIYAEKAPSGGARFVLKLPLRVSLASERQPTVSTGSRSDSEMVH